MLAKEPHQQQQQQQQQQQELPFDRPSQQRGNQYVAHESRKQAADNDLQFDRVMKVSKMATPDTPYKKNAWYSYF